MPYLTDLGLSIFNKEYTEQEQLRTRFPFIHEGVILIRNYDEFKLLQNSTYNTIIVLHYHNDTLMNMNVTDPEFNSNIVVDNWLNVSYNTLSEIEVDMVLFLHPIGEQNCSINDTISHVSSIEIYPGLLDEQVQSFQGDDAIPNHDFNQDPFVICESNALQCHEHQILLWFQVYKVAFGSLQHTSVKSKLEYRRALSFFR